MTTSMYEVDDDNKDDYEYVLLLAMMTIMTMMITSMYCSWQQQCCVNLRTEKPARPESTHCIIIVMIVATI